MATREEKIAFLRGCDIKVEPWSFNPERSWIQVYKDGCYLTASTTIDNILDEWNVLDLLIKCGITEVYSIYDSNVACYGFCPEKNEWVGWSHRDACGFTIGSKVKKGDVAYMPTDKMDYEEDMLRFWTDPEHIDIHIRNRTEKGFDILWLYSHSVPNEKIRGKVGGEHCDYPTKYGRGEWEAKTLDDARQMAMDYAENIG